MGRAHGARALMALAFEDQPGVAPAAGYWRMPFASATLGADQPLLPSELLGYGRDPLPPIKDALTADGDVVVPLDARGFGIWLKAALGAPITSPQGNDFTHVFQTGSWDLPTMAIEVGMPEVPLYSMYPGTRLNELSFTMQRSGQMTATARLIPRTEVTNPGTQAGMPANFALRRFGHANGCIHRNGVELANVVTAEFMYSNGLERTETIRCDGGDEGADPGMAGLRGRFDVRFADTMLLQQAIDGAPCEIQLSWTLPSGENLTITVHAVYLPRPRREISGPQGIQATFEWQAALAPAVGRMATFVLTNDVEHYDAPIITAGAPLSFNGDPVTFNGDPVTFNG